MKYFKYRTKYLQQNDHKNELMVVSYAKYGSQQLSLKILNEFVVLNYSQMQPTLKFRTSVT